MISPISSNLAQPTAHGSNYAGLRMSADAYLNLASDGNLYELIDGVVVLSPSPTPKHQSVLFEIATQLGIFLRRNPVGRVFPETDVLLSEELVYRPELVFLRADRVRKNWKRIHEAPDLVVEVVSPESRGFDSQTKKGDYERAGVGEYWLIDPDLESMVFFRLQAGRFVEIPVEGESMRSVVVSGFVLDLAAVRRSFLPG